MVQNVWETLHFATVFLNIDSAGWHIKGFQTFHKIEGFSFAYPIVSQA